MRMPFHKKILVMGTAAHVEVRYRFIDAHHTWQEVHGLKHIGLGQTGQYAEFSGFYSDRSRRTFADAAG
jgi:hypothetical protein